MKSKIVNYFIIGTFVMLYLIVSVISTIHVIDFFKLSNPNWLAVSLAIAFEIGAAASLASLIALKKMNRTLVWGLFFVLIAMQMMGNTYYAFTNLENYKDWVDLFGLSEEEPIFQKRMLSIISGAVLPLVALGFIKSLVDYVKPSEEDLVIEVSKPGIKQNEPALYHEDDHSKTNTNEEGPTKSDELEISQHHDEGIIVELPTNENIEEELSAESSKVMYSEEDKDSLLQAIQLETENTELTKEDIEIYKEKSRTPSRGREKAFIKMAEKSNPHVIPGVRT